MDEKQAQAAAAEIERLLKKHGIFYTIAHVHKGGLKHIRFLDIDLLVSDKK